MLVQSLTIEGFLGIQDRWHKEFSDGSTLFVGATGSGKSSVVAAIRWALFGTTRVKKSVDSVVNDQSDKAVVELVFEHGGEQYRVIRERSAKPAVTSLSVAKRSTRSWRSVGGKTVTSAQKKINSILGVDPKLLELLMFTERETFVLAKPEERRKALLSMLPDTSAWQADYEVVSARYKAEETRLAWLVENEAQGAMLDIQDIERDIKDAESELESLPTLAEAEEMLAVARGVDGGIDRTSIRNRLDALRSERAQEFARDESERKEKFRNIEVLTKAADGAVDILSELDELRSDKERLSQEVKALKNSSLQDSEALSEALAKASASLERERGRHGELSNSYKLLQSAGDCCPTCRSELGEEGISIALRTIDKDIKKSEGLIASLESSYQEALRERDDAVAANEENATTLKSAEAQLIDVNFAIRECEEVLSDYYEDMQGVLGVPQTGDELIDKADDYIAATSDELSSAPATMREPSEEELFLEGQLEKDTQSTSDIEETILAIKRANKDIAEYKDELQKVTDYKQEVDSEIAELTDRVEALGVLKRACSTKGVQTWLMGGVLQKLAKRQNDILSMTEFDNFVVRYSDQKFTKSGNATPTLDIMVAINGRERPVEALSGGERALITLTASIAIYGVLCGDTDDVGLIVFDETLTGLDDSAATVVCSVLEKLSSASGMGQIFVVSHDPAVIKSLASAGDIVQF